jgi:hypothetical protein
MFAYGSTSASRTARTYELVFLFGLGVVYAIAFRLVSNTLVLWPLLTPLGAFYNNVEPVTSICPGRRVQDSQRLGS